MKKISAILAALPILLGLIALPANAATITSSGSASTNVSSDTTVTAKTTLPATAVRYTQWNNLAVNSVTVINSLQPGIGPVARIDASNEVHCTDSSATTNGRNICPEMPTRLYQIYVWNDTKILSVNRKPIALDKIKQGDHINAYGKLRDDSSMDASIVRDLDYSNVVTPIQLENLTVASIDSANNGTITLTATGLSNTCYRFPNGSKTSMVCPMGLTKDMTTNSSVSSQLSIVSRPTKYSVVISPTTQVIDMTRRAIKASSIRVGDTINVYGTIADDQTTVTAQVVRVTRRAPAVSTLTITADSETTVMRRRLGVIPMSVSGGTSSMYSWYLAPSGMGALVQGATYGLPPGMSITQSYPYPTCNGDVCNAVDPLPTQAWIAGTPTTRGTYVATIGVRDMQSGAVGTLQLTIFVR